MLIRFRFKNFKSFKDEAELDLSAAKMTEFAERVVLSGGIRVLPVAAIFGANASGKTNVYDAFGFMTSFVLRSFGYGDDEHKYEEERAVPFLFDVESENEDSVFEVTFTIPGDNSGRTYNYGFSMNEAGISKEWFNSKAKTARQFSTVYFRDGENLEMPGIPKNSRENIEVALEKQVLIVSLGAKLKIDKCKMVRDWFFHNIFANFGDAVKNLFMSRVLPDGFVEDDKVRLNVVEFFSTFDDHIKGFEVSQVPNEDGKSDKRYRIESLHQKEGVEEMAGIPLEEESAGTLKMFALYPALMKVLSNGSIFFVDELNARLHPLLVRNIILAFCNPEINVNHAQLVFTAHDTWQMSNQLLRRDEIWLTEKDAAGKSRLFSLADFEDEDGDRIRKDEIYEKNYLLGKYGAVPSLKSIQVPKLK